MFDLTSPVIMYLLDNDDNDVAFFIFIGDFKLCDKDFDELDLDDDELDLDDDELDLDDDELDLDDDELDFAATLTVFGMASFCIGILPPVIYPGYFGIAL